MVRDLHVHGRNDEAAQISCSGHFLLRRPPGLSDSAWRLAGATATQKIMTAPPTHMPPERIDAEAAGEDARAGCPPAARIARRRWPALKQHSALPGFSLSLGYSLLYLSLIVLLPLTALALRAAKLSWAEFWKTVASPRVVASYKLSFGAALVASAVDVVAGLLLAWVLVRYRFIGRRLMDSAIDLPFALPTAVAGISLATVYSPSGWIGRWLTPLGIRVTERPLGVVVALTFIGLPFVVRTVQPILEDLAGEVEEAAASLGASRLATFRRVILPELYPALITGFALAFARAVGEYGSVIFIAGNMPMKTEIAPLMIVTKLEEYSYGGATAIALVLLVASLIMLLSINLLQSWLMRSRN
jgi:sulfate transport system permease protein